MTRRVVLVPGLWMPAAAMALLARALRAYEPRVFTYRGRESHERNIEALARFAGDGACLVGHSLGGVLIYDMLVRHPEVRAGAVVLLGAPVRGCLAGRRFGRGAVGRWMMGACCSLWSERAARWRHPAPLGVVAGTRPFGLGRVFGGALPGPNDGVVRVEETTVDGMAERVLVREAHSTLIVSRNVGALVARFLARGAFA